jgi:hypothetical protein
MHQCQSCSCGQPHDKVISKAFTLPQCIKVSPMLKVTSTLSGKKEEFKSLVPHKMSMYVCGITPYDNAHVGHGRCYVSFDMLYRVVQFLGYDVRYCRNLTDIE